MYTVFQTPGSFDLKSLDTFGLNVKPNSTPITDSTPKGKRAKRREVAKCRQKSAK